MTSMRKLALAGLLAAGMAEAANVAVTPAAAANDVPPLKTGRVTGTVLSVYNSPATFAGIRKGLVEQGFRLLRFPNGSMSNMYHWNGAGARDSVGIWHADSTKVLPGILSLSRYRGTTNLGSADYSKITDGVDSTFWWSDPLGGDRPWVQLNFKADSTVDSVRIVWGTLAPDSVVVGTLATSAWNGFAGLDAKFVPLGYARVTGSVTGIKLPATSLQFLAIRPVGVKAQGVQIGEVTAWNGGAKATRNTKSAANQTEVTAMGAHPGNDQAPNWTTPPAWTFAKYIDYLKGVPNVEALICVNYGTGTPEEAAAWVKYANIDQKLGIKFWEIGNEMDGYWEEGGPVTARQYVAKYLAFAKAMKAVDPSILIFGPVMSTSEFDVEGSFHLDSTTWTEEVLRLIGEAEVKDNTRYLDGFDFHAYSYWTDGKPSATAALSAMSNLKPRLDTLGAMMARRLSNPGSRLVNMSEVNMSVISMDMLLRPENATGIALNLSQLVETFGGNSMSIVWEGYNGGGTGSAANGGTYGALTLFNEPRSGSISSQPFVPSAAYWGNWIVSKVWAMDSAKPLGATVTGAGNLEARALVKGSDTSWLFLNLSAGSHTVTVPNFSSGWIYSFSKSQFVWNGTNDQAFAFPNSGPSGTPIPAGWNHQVVVPAYGTVVVRNTPAVITPFSLPAHVVNVTLNKKQIEVGDTVKVSGTVLRSTAAGIPTMAIGDTTISLSAIDGKWDSDMEGFVASIPAELLGEGDHVAVVAQTDSIPFKVTGKVRPNLWIDRFNDNALASEQPSKAKWNYWQADKEDSSAWDLTFVPGEGNSYFLRSQATLVQPADLGYSVAGYTGLVLDSALVANSLGIKFDYATWHSSKVGTSFALGVPTDTVKDYQDYSVSLANTDSAWRAMRVLWSQFSQPSWAVQCGPLQPRQINALNFRIQGEGKAVMFLDNIALLGTTGDSVTSVGPRVRAGLSIRRAASGWSFQAPAGTEIILVGLDGRRQDRLVVPSTGVSHWTPRGNGVVFAVIQTATGRTTRMLPTLR